MRPFFLRGFTQADFADTVGRTLPVVTQVPGVHVLGDGGGFFDCHRVIHLERDLWVSEQELSDLTAEQALGRQLAMAVLFWVGIVVAGTAFAVMTLLGVLPA
jgi:hypothetical protein